MTSAIEAVPVAVQGKITVEREEISGYGFTISHLASDTNPTQPLLPQDSNRIRALVFANSASAFIGTPEQMSVVSAQMTGADNGPGCRIPSGAIGTELYTTDEVWVGFTGVCQIGVWVERRIPRS